MADTPLSSAGSYFGYNAILVDHFVDMGFPAHQVVMALGYAGVTKTNGEDYEIEEDRLDLVMATLLDVREDGGATAAAGEELDYGGYNRILVDRFVDMGFPRVRVVASFALAGVSQDEGVEDDIDDDKWLLITTRLLDLDASRDNYSETREKLDREEGDDGGKIVTSSWNQTSGDVGHGGYDEAVIDHFASKGFPAQQVVEALVAANASKDIRMDAEVGLDALAGVMGTLMALRAGTGDTNVKEISAGMRQVGKDEEDATVDELQRWTGMSSTPTSMSPKDIDISVASLTKLTRWLDLSSRSNDSRSAKLAHDNKENIEPGYRCAAALPNGDLVGQVEEELARPSVIPVQKKDEGAILVTGLDGLEGDWKLEPMGVKTPKQLSWDRAVAGLVTPARIRAGVDRKHSDTLYPVFLSKGEVEDVCDELKASMETRHTRMKRLKTLQQKLKDLSNARTELGHANKLLEDLVRSWVMGKSTVAVGRDEVDWVRKEMEDIGGLVRKNDNESDHCVKQWVAELDGGDEGSNDC